MQRFGKLFLAALVISALVGAGCSGNKDAEKKAATITAMKAFGELRTQNLTGSQAAEKATTISSTLDGAGLGLGAIETSFDELAQYVVKAYERDVRNGLTELKATHGNPDRARKLKAQIVNDIDLAGKTYRDFNTSEALLSQSLARNGLEFAKAQGAPITPAMYKAAGLPANTVYRTRTVRVTTPAKPKPAPRPTTKPRL